MSDEELGAYIRGLENDLKRLGLFLHTVAAALDVPEEWGGGVAEERILQRINELKGTE